MSKNSAKRKPKVMSDIEFNKLFFNNEESCRNFFINLFFPLGFICSECGCIHHFTMIRTRNNTF